MCCERCSSADVVSETFLQVTSPVASSVFHGGQAATITWQDDGQAPSLQEFGNAKVSIYVGNAQQQACLATQSPKSCSNYFSDLVANHCR